MRTVIHLSLTICMKKTEIKKRGWSGERSARLDVLIKTNKTRVRGLEVKRKRGRI